MRHRRKSISLIKKINLKNYLTSKNGQIYTALVTEVCYIHFRSVIFPENDCNKKFAAKSGSYLANEPLYQKCASSNPTEMSSSCRRYRRGVNRTRTHGERAFLPSWLKSVFFCILLSKNVILFNRKNIFP